MAEFHQGFVGRSAGRLDNEDVMTTDAVADFDTQFAVAEGGAQSRREGATEVVANIHSQLGVGRTSNDLEVAVHSMPS